jgi:GNAT superfamily N-acetyltransferase
MVFVKVYDYYKLNDIDSKNGYYDNPSWKNKKKEFKKLTNQFCSDKVAIKYSNDYALEDATLLIEGYISGNEKMGKIGGFLIGNDNYSDYIYIDVVCSNKGLGKILIDRAKDIAKAKNLRGVILSSLEHVIGYYRKHDFENKESCSNNEEIVFLNNLYKDYAEPVIKKYGSKLPEILNDVDMYRHYLDIISANGLTPDKNCKEAKCNSDGYTMAWCNENYTTDDSNSDDSNSFASGEDSYEDITLDDNYLDDQILEGGGYKEPRRRCKRCNKKMSGGKGRCWTGYEPVPGKKPYSKGSCRRI